MVWLKFSGQCDPLQLSATSLTLRRELQDSLPQKSLEEIAKAFSWYFLINLAQRRAEGGAKGTQ